MIRSLIICSCWLVISLAYYLFVGGSVAVSVLLLSILLMGYLLLSVFRTAKVLTSTIEQTGHVVKNEPTMYEITIQSSRKMHALKAKLHISITHSALNITDTQIVEALIYNKRTIIPLQLQHMHCGQYEIAVTEIEIVDILQLFSKKIKLNSYCKTIVKPLIAQKAQFKRLQTFWQQGVAHISTNVDENGEELAQFKPYIPGDQVKKIHWKLSSKLDELYVQQFLNPQQHHLALAIDFSRLNNRVELYDQMMEKLAALLMLALQDEHLKLAYWQERWQLQTIRTEHDIADALQKMLSKPVEQLVFSTLQQQQLLAQHPNVYIITVDNCSHVKVDEQARRDNV